jgi:hypothetical protein
MDVLPCRVGAAFLIAIIGMVIAALPRAEEF